MYSRLLNITHDKSFFLFGPRGTGKTTWVKSSFPKAVYVDLLEAENFNRLLANPQRIEDLIPKDYSGHIIIDEIQRVPELLNEIHRLIESSNNKFILTGSNARKIRKGGHNLLAGRALTYFMHPLTSVEMKKDFNLEKAILLGTLPSLGQESNPKKYLESYVKTYLEQEILQEGLTRNISAFARFLEVASFSNGSMLNTAGVAREAFIERKVVENYFSILEDMLIGYKLYPFRKKAKRRLVSHPKFYFFDTGIYRIIRPQGPLDKPEEIGGVALENLFFQNLLAVNVCMDLGYKIYYYRTSTGIEVDFIAYGKKGIRAFEIKRSRSVSSKDLRGLKHFLKLYPESNCVLVYGGKKKMRRGGIDIVPAEEAFDNILKLLK